MGLMGLMAILGSLDRMETKGANIRKIVCGNDCVEYKLSSRMPQLPRWRPRSLPLLQAVEFAHDPTNSSSTRVPR
jgi:hypothetical protein